MNINTMINAIYKLETRALTRTLNAREQRQLESLSAYCYDNIMKGVYDKAEQTGAEKLGKHIIPRNLYHLTTASAYENMLRTGSLEAREACDSRGKQVFLFDIKNFTKYWRKTKKTQEQPRTTLLDLIAQLGERKNFEDDVDLVLLKVPTEKLNLNNLKIRIQELLRCGIAGQAAAMQEMLKDPHITSNGLKFYLKDIVGIPAKNAPLCNQKKQSIEWLHSTDIPISDVQLVGKTKVSIDEVEKAANEMKDMPELWNSLTSGQPEQIAFKHMR